MHLKLFSAKFTEKIFLRTRKYDKTANRTVNWFIFSITLLLLFIQMRSFDFFSEAKAFFPKVLEQNFFLLLFIFALSLAQLFFEAKRWQLSLEEYTPIKFREALLGVMSGSVLSVFLPFGIGNLAGKFSQIKTNLYGKALHALAFAGLWQSYAGVVMMLFALLFFAELQAVLGMVAGIIVLFVLKKISEQKSFLGENAKILLRTGRKIFMWSLLKHGVFVVQYTALLSYSEKGFSQEIFRSVNLILGIKAFFPVGNFLTSYFFRENLALHFLSETNLSTAHILSAGFMLWFFNHFLLAFFSATFLFLQKIKQNKT